MFFVFEFSELSSPEQEADQVLGDASPIKHEESNEKDSAPKRKTRQRKYGLTLNAEKMTEDIYQPKRRAKSSAEHIDRECPDTDDKSCAKSSRSRREIKPTAKFKEYLLNKKGQIDSRQDEAEKIYRKGASYNSVAGTEEKKRQAKLKNTNMSLCSTDIDKTILLAQENEISVDTNERSKRRSSVGLELASTARDETTKLKLETNSLKDTDETEVQLQVLEDKGLNEGLVFKKEIMDNHAPTRSNGNACVMSEANSIDTNQVLFSETVRVKQEKQQHVKVSRGEKRKLFSNENKVTVKSLKNLPVIPVTLPDYPESFCIEEYISSDPLDKGKSAAEKLCQRYLCKLCNAYRTVSKEQMEKHITLHVNKRLNCQLCDTVFNSLHNLYLHVRQDHQLGVSYICEHCGNDFSEKRLYKMHLSKAHKEAAYECPKCNKQFLSNKEYKQHRLNDHENFAFKCEKCGGIFLTEKLLDNHRNNNVCEAKEFKCQFCDIVKKSQALLDEHIRKVHSKEHRFKCNLCTYSTGMNYMLKQHMRAHLGIHPHKCDHCKFTCVKKWQLVSHMRTHSGEKKYKCEKCNFAAGWNVQVKTHMKAHESDTQQVCKTCNIFFKDMRCYNIHVHKEHAKTKKISKSKSKRQNIVPVEGTNLVVYKTSGTSVEAGISTESYSFNEKSIPKSKSTVLSPDKYTRNASYSLNNKEEKTFGAEILEPLSESYVSDVTGTVVLEETSRGASKTDTEMRYLLAELSETPATQSPAEKIDRETGINDNTTVNTTPEMENSEAEVRSCSIPGYIPGRTSTDSMDCGSETDPMHIITQNTSFLKDTDKVSEKPTCSDKTGTASDNTTSVNSNSETNGKILGSQKKDIKYIRLHINPDGTRKFELVDESGISSGYVNSSINISIPSVSQSVAHNITHSAHNYALPAHKPTALQESYDENKLKYSKTEKQVPADQNTLKQDGGEESTVVDTLDDVKRVEKVSDC